MEHYSPGRKRAEKLYEGLFVLCVCWGDSINKESQTRCVSRLEPLSLYPMSPLLYFLASPRMRFTAITHSEQDALEGSAVQKRDASHKCRPHYDFLDT